MLWGVIRWDSWYNASDNPHAIPPGDPCQWVVKALSPPQWHDRLPSFAYVQPDGNVTFDENAPSLVAAEIELAYAAGLDHWVFDVYPPELSLSNSLNAYAARCIRMCISRMGRHSTFANPYDRRAGTWAWRRVARCACTSPCCSSPGG